MNARVVGIAVSLLANAVLVFALTSRVSRSDDAIAPQLPRAPNPSVHTSESSLERASTTQTWSELTSGSLTEVAARLNTEGFSARLQRVVLRALVAQQFADRHRAIADMIRARPWWISAAVSDGGAELIAARQQLQRDETDAVNAVLGPDQGPSPYVEASRRYRYGDLPPATLAELDRINSDYNELTNDIRNRAQGILLPEDREKLLYLERQRHGDIAQILTPEELFEHDMRSSPTGWWLRTQLADMNPSPEEFRAIFKVQHDLVSPFADGQYQLMSPEVARAWSAREPQLKDQIKAVLSPERFAEYDLKTDPNYRPTDAIVKRLELPPGTTASVVALQKEIAGRAAALRTNATLSPADRNTQLGVLAEEAIARLRPTLGEAGLTAYQQSAGGWIAALRPPPPPATPKG